jgi:hypothetical protein
MTKLELHVLLFAASVVVSSIGFAPPGANAAEHTLMPSPQTVHVGYFSAALKPVLTQLGRYRYHRIGRRTRSGRYRGLRPRLTQRYPRLRPLHPPRSHRSGSRSAHPDRAGFRQRGHAGGRAGSAHSRDRACRFGCGQLLMYRYFRNSVLIDLLPELFPSGFRKRERTQA